MSVLPQELLVILRSSGHPWRIEEGTKHHKIILAGKMVAICPKGSRSNRNSPGRAFQNIRAQLRRAVKELRA